ncbi:MAG: imidazoleglycerol-phosphate dehydratase HisB [Deltaproteobacteria bacterium]|nr:MAG: imidazoleglycerol-phosphate dehydratase HisB [Deltaproteobacteria bacterium]
MARKARVSRKTRETEVQVSLDLDGSGQSRIETSIGFFDHMLELLSRHGLLDMEVKARGDLHVDHHHTVEDVGICLGEALKLALGEGKGIRRFGHVLLPMDEALAMVAVDISGRPYLAFQADLRGKVGEFDVELVEVFFRAFCTHAGLTLHARLLSGGNLHHSAEALFKGLAVALREAIEMDPRQRGIPSTKGVL